MMMMIGIRFFLLEGLESAEKQCGKMSQSSLQMGGRRMILRLISAPIYRQIGLYDVTDLLGGASVSLTTFASERFIPGYGGDMSSAKAVLESDTKVLAFEARRNHGIRVNTMWEDRLAEKVEYDSEGNVKTQVVRSPFVKIPLGVSKDQLIGYVDVEESVKNRTTVFQLDLNIVV
ncbi:magnesium-chelatase subunit ChlD, chloroplastic [Tanacetum coccineum]